MSTLAPEKNELYNRVIETYKQKLKHNPDYPFRDHCGEYNLRAGSIVPWLNSKNIFIRNLKQEARDRLTAETIRQAHRVGAFVSVQPESEAMAGWRNTEIPRVEIYLPGKIHLTVKKGTASDVIALISTYAEKGGC